MKNRLFFLMLFLAVQGSAQDTTGWRAITLSANVALFPSFERGMLNNFQEPFGRINPGFAWSRTGKKWNEISIPVLVINQTRNLTIPGAAAQYLGLEEVDIPGRQTTRMETGIAYERTRLAKNARAFGLPVANSFGLSAFVGDYEFNSDVPNALVYTARAFALRPYASHKIILKTWKHLRLEFHSVVGLQVNNFQYNYEIINQEVVRNERSEWIFAYVFAARLQTAYIF